VQRREANVLKEFLPDKYEYCMFIPLTPVQEKLYEFFLSKNPVFNGKRLLPDYTALRKIWTHPYVLQYAYNRAKNGENKITAAELKKKEKSSNKINEDDESGPDDVYDTSQGTFSVNKDWWHSLITEHDLQSLYSSNKMMLLFEILKMCEQK